MSNIEEIGIKTSGFSLLIFLFISFTEGVLRLAWYTVTAFK